MICNVEYSAPVEVQVDTETGEVKRVVVLDELAEPKMDSAHGGYVVEEQGAIPIADNQIRKTAVKIAATGQWPAWEFGW